MIDGFPIDVNQAATFESEICKPGLVIAFDAADDVLKFRLKNRNNFDDTEEAQLESSLVHVCLSTCLNSRPNHSHKFYEMIAR